MSASYPQKRPDAPVASLSKSCGSQHASSASYAAVSRLTCNGWRPSTAGSGSQRAATRYARFARRGLRVYGWFSEGFDTLDLREAKALLGDLSP
jgi:hypothetical protein